ncbi:DUF3267 domain-containing protein [Halalkalibacter sp. APA_J-10(15)]|uniref:DUF3267 domain-containing protein n=1 Tax=unclassified Halalkalibacter TaxID=2893063 RepID=UPI001FF3ACEC|nr:DUF3267 domain-containing protein [Halalkalibacter sp. APA_J-10(15)]MCK0473950.1 DUF3267 domain-containing protein [Halalkalibacter sp. APA_J-10(15)]
MNCWKTIRVTQEYGLLRLILFSACTMLFSFLFYYLIISSFTQAHEFVHVSFTSMICSIVLLIATHKLLHLIPVWLCGKKASITCKFVMFLPLTSIKLYEPISRNLYVLSLITPAILLTMVGAFLSIMYPTYVAFISILTSVHFGLIFFDFVYLSYIVKAPKRSLVENHPEGFHILLKAS